MDSAETEWRRANMAELGGTRKSGGAENGEVPKGELLLNGELLLKVLVRGGGKVGFGVLSGDVGGSSWPSNVKLGGAKLSLSRAFPGTFKVPNGLVDEKLTLPRREGRLEEGPKGEDG